MVREGGVGAGLWSIMPYLRECDTPFNNNAAEAMSYPGKKNKRR
jgi:hypothetical protein